MSKVGSGLVSFGIPSAAGIALQVTAAAGFESESRDLKEQPGLETIMNVMSRCDPIKNPKITIKNRDPIKNP